jgi:hypothetical protein
LLLIECYFGLIKAHEIRYNDEDCIYYFGETWVNQNNTKTTCWQMSDGFTGLQFPLAKAVTLFFVMLVQLLQDLFHRASY